METQKSLAECARELDGAVLVGKGSEIIRGLSFDTRTVKPGTLFFAIPGSSRDGHSFVQEAFSSGAIAAVVERADALGDRPGLIVKDSRRALSSLAHLWYGSRSDQLELIGVTGTNGKTTTNWLVYHLLNHLKKRCFRMGTLGFAYPDSAASGESLTSPDPLTLHRDIDIAFRDGCEAGVLEVSSHALDQRRMDALLFRTAIFTNLTRDHLDYHGTMEQYGAAKLEIVSLLKPDKQGTIVINIDDPYSREFETVARSSGRHVITFGESSRAEFRISDLNSSVGTSSFQVIHREQGSRSVCSPLSGIYNAQNLLGAMLAITTLGYSLDDIIRCIPQIPQVPGRLEFVGARDVGVYIDYAHTPDALENVLKAVRPLTSGRLWVIIGCGGDRDRGKRPQMAAAAVSLSDCAVFTSDNPRTEDPEQILRDMQSAGSEALFVEVDRRKAIHRALSEARKGDTVVVAGKGHEDYQIIGTVKRPFSDAQVVRDFFEQRGEV
jgi:UDP-N-acetylmuramoyl-L-alanyl-D-glutamate--2,6-diaminopimelate ligase